MKLFTTMSLMITVVLFSSCASQKLESNLPFTLEEIYVQDWVGGRAESGKGTYVVIAIADLPASVQLSQLYYKNQVSDFTNQSAGDKKQFRANFKPVSKPDIQMHADASKEVGNMPPTLGVKVPFEIQKGEALLEYLEGNKTKYFILKNLEKKELLTFPSRPQGGGVN